MICVVYLTGTFSVTVQANNSTRELVAADELVSENPENSNPVIESIEDEKSETIEPEDESIDLTTNDSAEDKEDSAQPMTDEQEILEDAEQSEAAAIPIEPTVTLDGSLEVNGQQVLSANVGNSWNPPVIDLPFEVFLDHPEMKEFTYKVEVFYEDAPIINVNSEDKTSRALPAGAEVAVTVPKILEVRESSIWEFYRAGDKYIFVLPEMRDKEILTINFTAVVRSDLSLIEDITIDIEEEFLASFIGNNLTAETGEKNDAGNVITRPRYQLKASFGPTLKGDNLYDTLYDNRLFISSDIYQLGFDLKVEDLNSTEVMIYTSDWLQYYDPTSLPSFPNAAYQYYDTFDRMAITSPFGSVYFEIDAQELRHRYGGGELFKVFYLQDLEGNISQPKYLTIYLESEPEIGEMILDSVPHLKFNDIDLANVSVVDGFVTSSLKSGSVSPNPLLNAKDGNENLHIIVLNRNSGLANWQLTASLENFYRDGDPSADKIPASDTRISLDIENQTSVITSNSSVIYQTFDSDDFRTRIEIAALGIRQNAIRAGTFQGAINWELVNSIQ
jgi:hypothetical protein